MSLPVNPCAKRNHGEMIVDFPFRPRFDSKSTKASSKAIRFSDTKQVNIFEKSSECERDRAWYSKAEYQQMRKEMASEVRALSDMYRHDPNQIPSDQCIVGIENYLSRDIMREVVRQRAQHINAVLKEQDRQDELCVYDPLKIAFVSRRISESSQDRAHMFAKLAYQ